MTCRHDQDLQELNPGRDELVAAARWTLTHDPSPAYRALLVDTLGQFGIEDASAALG